MNLEVTHKSMIYILDPVEGVMCAIVDKRRRSAVDTGPGEMEHVDGN